MTEQEWLTSDDPALMLSWAQGEDLRGDRLYPLSERKLRLFAAGCYRSFPGFDEWASYSQALWCVHAAESLADDLPLPPWEGQTVDSGAEAARLGLEILCHCVREDAAEAARFSAASPMEAVMYGGIKSRQAALLRDIVGSPFRADHVHLPFHRRAELITPTVLAIAQHVYDERRWEELPILADALEDAGSRDGAILTHLRSPGPHVRGCWALDLILGRS